jgi:hypothetical protein
VGNTPMMTRKSSEISRDRRKPSSNRNIADARRLTNRHRGVRFKDMIRVNPRKMQQFKPSTAVVARGQLGASDLMTQV